jgi:hypothetical protein
MIDERRALGQRRQRARAIREVLVDAHLLQRRRGYRVRNGPSRSVMRLAALGERADALLRDDQLASAALGADADDRALALGHVAAIPPPCVKLTATRVKGRHAVDGALVKTEGRPASWRGTRALGPQIDSLSGVGWGGPQGLGAGKNAQAGKIP